MGIHGDSVRAEACRETMGSGTLYKTGLVTGNTAAGIGVGVVAGITAVIGAAVAEVAVPAFLVLKAFGLTGGALGFLKGMKKLDR